jgi:hypothetical protein
MSNMTCQTFQNMVELHPYSCTCKAWNSLTPYSCTCKTWNSSNTFTLPLKNQQLTHQNIFYYMVPRCMNIHVVGAWKYALDKFTISLHVNASIIHPSTLVLLCTVALSFFNSLSWLYNHLNYTGPPTQSFQGKCTSKCCIALNHLRGNIFSILHTSTVISFSNFCIIIF